MAAAPNIMVGTDLQVLAGTSTENNIQGNLTVSGTITGNVTGDITGNVSGSVTGDFTGAVTLNSFTVLTVPDATASTAQCIFVSDATGAHVTGSLCFSNGTDWIDVTTGIAVA